MTGEEKPRTLPGADDETLADDTRETLDARSLFDAASVRHARPAEPLPEMSLRRRAPSSSLRLLMVLVAAGLIGAAVGGVTIALYRSGRQAPPPQPSTQSLPTGGDTAPAQTEKVDPEADEARDVPAGPDANANNEAPAATPAAANDGDSRAALRGALDDWVAATNRRDIDGQMEFYGERLGSYYRARGASRAAVRADKSRVFGAARGVSVSADEPDVKLSDDGRDATMRFRKRYSIEQGGGTTRRGEVLQELRWRRDDAGRWRIFSERDVRVIQ